MMGEDFSINDKIMVRMPTVGEIIRFGERNISRWCICFVLLRVIIKCNLILWCGLAGFIGLRYVPSAFYWK